MITHKHKFVSARFCDNDRKIVSVLWSDHINADEVYEDIIEARDSDESWQHLLNFTTIDEIHEETWNYIKTQRKAFKKYVKSIGADNSPEVIFTRFNKFLFDKEVNKEILFKAKLLVFELPFVKNYKGRTLKSNLRKAETILDTYKILFEIKAKYDEQTVSD
jgi:hypothetical protein